MINHYSFKNKLLFTQALTHKSAATEHNERLEFLGDALLNGFVSDVLYHQFPLADEGQLSRLRASLVNQTSLAEIARQLKLGDQLLLGAGEMKSGGQYKDSLLADAVEALIAAIYLDSSIQTCKQVVLCWFAEKMEALTLSGEYKDNKTILQEWLQARHLPLPRYRVVEEKGPDNEREFTVSCSTIKPAYEVTERGKSKKQAEQAAADLMLKLLEQNYPGHGNRK